MRRATRVGRYQLLNRIAYGGMAEIYRGITYDQTGFRYDVAVKKLLPRLMEDRNFIEMLTDEFKLVSNLKHANIAEVYELTNLGGEVIIAMEYVDGKDLRSTVEQTARVGGPLSIDDAIYIMARALDGLHHAHIARDGEGKLLHIVHRDFSPSNILLSYDGNVKICDFGIAKATNSRVQTQTGIIKGKVKYMSPEQAFGRSLDWRSDIFGAGSVLYELATGTSAFAARTERELIFAVREATPTPAHEANADVPEELSAIIARAMAKSRSGRYQSCLDFRDDLLEFLAERNPEYRRTHLARRMKVMWAEAIEKELRALEEYVLDQSTTADYGVNLIADALGPEARFSRFHPSPTASVMNSISGSGASIDLTTQPNVRTEEDPTEPTAAPLPDRK